VLRKSSAKIRVVLRLFGNVLYHCFARRHYCFNRLGQCSIMSLSPCSIDVHLLGPFYLTTSVDVKSTKESASRHSLP
jgi:hypothetical protein